MDTIYDMKAFYRWLAEAQDRELLHRRDSLLRAMNRLTDEDVLADAKYLLKMIEEEILAREIRD